MSTVAAERSGGPVVTTGTARAGRPWWSGCSTPLVTALALLGSLAVYHELWGDPLHRTLGRHGHQTDPIQSMWDLKWVAWQVVHGHDPFLTRAIFYPHGVSLSWNTLTPTLGILAAPVTLTAGAVLAYALLITAAPALATVTGYWWLRRHTRRPAAAVGGLVIGFNPYMTGHLQGHLNLVFVAAVPIMLMLSEDLLWRRPRPARRTALYLGLVTAAQAGISEELVLITAIGALLVLIAAAVVDGPWTKSALRSSWRDFGLAISIFLIAASPLLVSQLFLAPAVPLRSSRWRALGGDYLWPLRGQLLGLRRAHATVLGGAEDGVYLGPVLIAVLVIGIAVTAARHREVRVAALALAGLVVLTFGNSGPAGIPLPWRVFSGLPALTSILPGRFSFASWLIIAWLLSRWSDQLVGRSRTVPRRGVIWRGGALVAIAVSLVMIAPKDILAQAPPAPVAFFTSMRAQSLLAAGAPVLLLPMPSPFGANGMYYQQQADFRFSQPGGYAMRPEGRQDVALGPPGSALVDLSARCRLGVPPPASDAQMLAGRQQLVWEHYRAIIVVRSAVNAGHLTELAERLAERGPDLRVGGVWLWLLHPNAHTPAPS